ncbi:NAD(P)H-flavin reductase [Amycolatopsis marina]|uniref:nitric oxide dioxygenase n=1 Tax=Amycolatopsis marina TaxID=490629 RepID=A0A1I0VM19_9PSEU|nr:globin domain-containing protein [Amycolatopsis marina]SFA77372.1 NAD(P)H-flavin reductase [Amycolatopsis marina]
MSVNPVHSVRPPEHVPPSKDGSGETVRLIRESFAEVESQAEQLSQYFYGALFSIAPDTRDLFPINMSAQRSRLLRALVHIVQLVDRPEELAPFLHQLDRDHRKFDVLARHYNAVGSALLAALRRHLKEKWTPEVERAWTDAFAIVSRNMQEAAAAESGRAWWYAQVVDHHRPTRDIAVVTVRPEHPVPYRAGNHLSVEIPQRPRLWRYLSPANAPRQDGTIEFHVRSVEGGWVSRAIVNHARAGDTWRLGPALGTLAVHQSSGRDLLLIGGGTGLSPLRAMLEDLSGWTHSRQVRLLFGGRTKDDLYCLAELREFCAVNPWLTVTPVTEQGKVPGGEQGTLAGVAAVRDAWNEHDVLVSGSPGMIRATVARLLSIGIPSARITYDPFTH